jgi:hypothetical protein
VTISKPSSLSSLIAWYRSEVDAAIPQRINEQGLDMSGAPQWHGAFRAYLTMHPAAEDDAGGLRSPLRYWLWRLGGGRERYLHALAMVDFDWVTASNLRLVGDRDAAHDYTRESLKRLHRLMYDDHGLPREPRRLKFADCAALGCTERTPRLFCRAHSIPAGQA